MIIARRVDASSADGARRTNEPSLVLVDEPTASLDSGRGKQVVESLIQEVKSRGKLGLTVTHDLAMAHLADRVLEMHDGELRQVSDASLTPAGPVRPAVAGEWPEP